MVRYVDGVKIYDDVCHFEDWLQEEYGYSVEGIKSVLLTEESPDKVEETMEELEEYHREFCEDNELIAE